MNYQQKLKHFAGAKRITVQEIHLLESGNFVKYFCGKLRGKIVSTQNGFKFKSKKEAWQNAFDYRKSCLDELKDSDNV